MKRKMEEKGKGESGLKGKWVGKRRYEGMQIE